MNLVYAALDILCLLALSDGAVPEEVEVVRHFLENNEHAHDIDAPARITHLKTLDYGHTVGTYQYAVGYIRDNASEAQQRQLLEFAVKLAVADEMTTNIETVSVEYLAKELGLEPDWPDQSAGDG